jgi:RNAse (barnase) inhibitor barstar
MMKTLTIEGGRIVDIPSFYDEINRVFMAEEAWRLGDSLDALDDLLTGNYGAAAGPAPVRLVWREMASSRAALGFDATAAHLRAKLQRPEIYDAVLIRRQLDALERGTGKSYFDIVLEIIASHPRIKLVPDQADG